MVEEMNNQNILVIIVPLHRDEDEKQRWDLAGGVGRYYQQWFNYTPAESVSMLAINTQVLSYKSYWEIGWTQRITIGIIEPVPNIRGYMILRILGILLGSSSLDWESK
jgi:hypothetical protein